MDKHIVKIINKATQGDKLTKSELIDLIELPDASREAFALRAEAANAVRKRTGNTSVIFGQIGFEMHPCEANCTFCSFAQDYTQLETIEMDDESIAAATKNFSSSGDLYVLYLMMMATYDMDKFLDKLKIVKKHIAGPTKLVSNVGDTSIEDFLVMKEAGIDGVYHCWRLGEGIDTPFSPERRKQTMLNAKEAGLEVLDAVEPIGPEHTADEIAEHILFSAELGVLQSGSMKRIPIKNTPFENKGMITDFKLSKIVAAQALANLSYERLPWLGIHEPSPLGYMSGANMITAETGVNPRDTEEDTSKNRGLDIPACREILRQCGFDTITRGDGSTKSLM